MSSNSNQFKKSFQLYEKAKSDTLLKKDEYEKAESFEADCKFAFFTNGLMYYDTERRTRLLESAEKLCYPAKKIDYLKALDNEKWNADDIKIEDIIDLLAVEDFVEKKTPKWEKSVFYKIGTFLDK